MTPQVRAVIEMQCRRAREYFARARTSLTPQDAPRLVAAEIMAAIYEEILARIQRAEFDVFTTRHRVPRLRRAWIALQIWTPRVFAGFVR
jgi:phytoene synthase